MKSVMGHSFSQVPQATIQRSTFDRSHGYKTTFNCDDLIPFYVDFAVPGDTFNLNMTAIARIATLLKPPMDNLFLDTHFFSVPYRLVWDNWEKFNGEQAKPGDATDFTIPMITAPASTGYATGSLEDYMGLPVGVAGYKHSALPLRAYRLIYNNWYRSQDLIDSETVQTGDGPEVGSNYQVLKRCKKADYFTAALPWPQKGDSVLLPLGQRAPVSGFGKENLTTLSDNRQAWETDHTTISTFPKASIIDVTQSGGAGNFYVRQRADNGGLDVYADLSEATAANINDLRQAFQYQRLLERDARGGTRYPEIIKSHFQVRDPQFDVLQRPQYLGGGTSPISIHSVAQASPTGTYANTPQANLAAYGMVQAMGHGFTKSFTEHCIVMGIMSVRADLTYSQGLDRQWSYETRFEHYWPALANLGEQAIKNKELFTTGTSTDEEVFGYIPRYDEMRIKKSVITGLFKPGATTGTPLDFWHLSEEFANQPVLNDEFIKQNTPMERIIAVNTEPHFIFDAYIKLICARPMPVFGVPGMIDHF